MARSLNKVMLIGNCAGEPEVRSQQESYKVVTISVATNEHKSDGNGGWKELTEWHRISLWNQNADYALQYVHKGSRVYIEGRLRSYSYQDRNHPEVTHRNYEIVADNIISLDGRRQDDAQGAYNQTTPSVARPNGSWSAQTQFNQDNYAQGNTTSVYGQQGVSQPQPMAQPQPPMQTFNNFNNAGAGAFPNYNNGMGAMPQNPQGNGFQAQPQAAAPINNQPQQPSQAPQAPGFNNNDDIPF